MEGAGADAKADLRREMVLRLRKEEQSGSLETRLHAIERAVVAWCGEHLPRGAVVAVFGGLKREVDLVTRGMPQLHALGLRTAAFALDESILGEMVAIEVVNELGLRRGIMGVWEPQRVEQRLLTPDAVQAVMVPGLAFCPKSGFRLGRGGGYFDRYLSRMRPDTLRVGVAMECQLVEGLPIEPHDVPVQWIITEHRVVEVDAEKLKS